MARTIAGLAVFALVAIGFTLTHDYRPRVEHQYICNFAGWCKRIARGWNSDVD